MLLALRTHARHVGAFAGVGALVAVGLAMPASAAEPASVYAAGDVVTVDGASVTAPAPGNTVALSIDRIDGSTMLVVSTDAEGVVTVSDGIDAATAGTDATALAPNKCSDNAYSLINGSAWPGTYNWNFRSGTTPNELTKAGATKALRASVNNITKASNNCKLADQVSAKNSYKGSTSQASDVTSEPACKANPGAQNVTEFGPIGGGGILAATCTYSGGGRITDADVRINTQFEWWTGGSCSGNRYAIKAVQTHEYGHAFGLGHVEEGAHGNLTMSTNINAPCSNFEASLGKGDVLALRDLY